MNKSLPNTIILIQSHCCLYFGYWFRYDCCMCAQGEGGACSNCGVVCTVTQVTAKGALCNSCYQHWRYVCNFGPT